MVKENRQFILDIEKIAHKKTPRIRFAADTDLSAGQFDFAGSLVRQGQGYVSSRSTIERKGETPKSFRKVINEYKRRSLHTPELVTLTHQVIWQQRGAFVSESYEVTPCPYSQEEIAGLEANGNRLGFLPAELAREQARVVLGKMFPKMEDLLLVSNVEENKSVKNIANYSGWFDYETSTGAPYLDTSEGQLLERIRRDGRRIITLNEYIVASQDNRIFTGDYLDNGETSVRLGTIYEGPEKNPAYRDGLITAHFNRNGRLELSILFNRSNRHLSSLGGRSSGVK